MAALTDRGVPFSTVGPKYLHTNSTSHTQPFSAIAELIDNAYDPDVNAKQFWIDKTVVHGQDCLSFMDNGNGMDYETMHKMLSFGYSEKVAKHGKAPIGMYGNGFKSGSMRLGKDAIVFSKSKTVRCVGMLSQTYLEEIKAQQIIVPIVCYEQAGREKFSLSEEHKVSLQEILSYSPFKTQKELLDEIDVITSSGKNTGTRIIIWNLRCDSSGKAEFDFDFDRYDIRMPSDVYQVTNVQSQHQVIKSYIPDCVYSLRAYCRILYLKPRMQIIIRGQNVKSELIAKSLALSTKDQYKPLFLTKAVPITFGYNTKSKDQCGVMMYHKNRLIRAYERVGCQLRAQNKGIGVIAIIECNFLEPTHNKQSFIESDKYRKTINSLGVKLEEYWEEIRHRRKKEDPNSVPVEDAIKKPDQNWVQCDTCLKWRKLPDGIDNNKLPDEWYCRLNPDPQFRSCQAEEEAEDSEDEQPYRKTYKQQQREDKKLKEKKKQMEAKDAKCIKEQLLAEINWTKKDLDRQHVSLRRQLFEKSAPSPTTPTTTKSAYKNNSPSGGSPGAISSPACSPASNDGLPRISNVYSLTPGLQGQKRPQLAETPRSNKKSKVMGANQDTPDAPASVDVCHDHVHADILENANTPKSQMPNSDLNKLKAELEESNISMQMECSNDAATQMGLEKSVATQTNVMVKNENLSQFIGVTAQPIVRPQSADVPINFALEKLKQEETCRPHGEDDGGHFHTPNRFQPCASGVLEQREQLREQMEEAIKERDTLKERVHMLTHQLQEARQKADELIKDKNNAAPQVDGLLLQLDECKKEKDEVCSQVDGLLLQVDECKKEKDEVRSQVDGLLLQLDECNKEKDEARSRVDGLLLQVDECKKEKDEVRSQVNGLLLQLDECKKEKDEVRSQVDSLLLQLDECKKEKDEERSQVDSLLLHLNECKKEKDEVCSQVDGLLLQLDECKKERDEARSQADGLLVQLDQWKKKSDEVRSQCAEFMLKLQRGENAP